MIPAALSNKYENDYCTNKGFETDHIKHTSLNGCSFCEFSPLACNQLGHCMEIQPLLSKLLRKFLKHLTLQAKINVFSDNFPHLQWGRIHWNWRTSQLESILIPSSVRTHGLKVEAWIQHVYCVLHALRRHQVPRSDAERLYKLNVCIVFYTHWGDMRVATVRPGDGMNASFVLCFTCVEATSGYHKSCQGMI